MALLVINNLRDIETDTETDKRTLAVLLGAKRTQHLFLFLVFSSVPLYCLFSFFFLLASIASIGKFATLCKNPQIGKKRYV